MARLAPRIAIWVLSLGAVVLIALILRHSGSNEDVNSKVFAAVVLFVPFSISSLAGFLLIKRQPQLAFFGALTIGLSAAAYLVTLETFISNGPFVFLARQVSVWTLVIVAVATSQISMLLSFRRDDDNPLVDAVVFGSLAALALLAVLVVIEISGSGTEIGRKTLAIVSVLYLLGALLPPCLRLAEAGKASPSQSDLADGGVG